MKRTGWVIVLSVLAGLAVLFWIGVFAGWWPYEWWRAFGLGTR